MLPEHWGCQLCSFYCGSGTKHLLVLLDYLNAQLCLTASNWMCFSVERGAVFHFELQSLGQSVLHDSGNIPTMDIGAIVKALRQHFGLRCHSWGGPNYWAVAYRCFCSSDLVLICFDRRWPHDKYD